MLHKTVLKAFLQKCTYSFTKSKAVIVKANKEQPC